MNHHLDKGTLWIIVRVIDNLGDAGFSLRLALALQRMGYVIWLWTDRPQVFEQLLGTEWRAGLEVREIPLDSSLNTWLGEERLDNSPTPKAVLEPFGTSRDHTNTGRFSIALQNLYPGLPWLLVDYLSAETWIEDFHLKDSISPSNGYKQTFFYPGFTPRTGGLIHSDCTPVSAPPNSDTPPLKRVFLMCYGSAPIQAMVESAPTNVLFNMAGDGTTPTTKGIDRLPFVKMTDFDQLLANHDFLFVRGEDSFVRAQLLGKPMVWHVYPTPDGAHWSKLKAFFDLYSKELDDDFREPLWALWRLWNGLNPTEVGLSFGGAWQEVKVAFPALYTHARLWADHLRKGPELVREILRWLDNQSPTSE